MTIFEAVKSTVTPRMAAEHYGMTVARNGMVCCPFHNDRHPSMKLSRRWSRRRFYEIKHKKHHPIHPKYPIWDGWGDGMDVFQSKQKGGIQ